MALRPRSSDSARGTLLDRVSRLPHPTGSLGHFEYPLNLLLGFAPFAAFTVLSRLSISFALWTAFATAFALGLPVFLHTRTIRTLDGGGVALFGLLAFLSGFFPALTNFETTRFVVIIGMLATVLVSFILRDPFARSNIAERRMPARHAGMRQNSSQRVWAGCLCRHDCGRTAIALYVHGTPALGRVLLVNLVALATAITFTLRYPASMRRKRDMNTK